MAAHTRLDLHGAKVKARHRKALRAALKEAGEHLLGASNERIPYDQGELQLSGDVAYGGDGKEAAVFYDALHAVWQHERLDYKHDPGRSAKFLETAVVEDGDAAIAAAGEAYRREMR